MSIWVIGGLLTVAFIKYYTAIQMRNLNRRLNNLKADHRRYTEGLQKAQDRLDSIRAKEEHQVERIKKMKEIVMELSLRLTLIGQSQDE